MILVFGDPQKALGCTWWGCWHSWFWIYLLTLRQGKGAKLLASKSLLNSDVPWKGETWPYSIVYNAGSSAVCIRCGIIYDVFPLEDFFDIVSGMLSVKWDQITPASSVSHTVVLHPLKAGYFASPQQLLLTWFRRMGPLWWALPVRLDRKDPWLSESLTGILPPFPGLDDLGVMTLPSHWHTPALVELQQEGRAMIPPKVKKKWMGSSQPFFPRCPGASRLQRVSQTQSLLP